MKRTIRAARRPLGSPAAAPVPSVERLEPRSMMTGQPLGGLPRVRSFAQISDDVAVQA
jgi:hypothetical protein